MTVYTVHERAARKRASDSEGDRFVFVRDGFHFWAFLFGPLWMLRHRLWLVLLIFVGATAAIQAGLWALGVSGGVRFAVGFLIALLIGLEAATLRRWTYRRYTDHGVVVASDSDSAERRFFDLWAPHRTPAPPFMQPPPVVHAPPSSDVIGLFPEPQSQR